MSKIHIDRLAKSLGLDPKDIRGIKYEKLVQAICVKNSENISKKVTKINQDEWSRAMDKIGTKEKRFIVPSLNDVMSRNNVSIRKSAENGTLISNTLHEGLVKTLNRTMQDFTVRSPTRKNPYSNTRKIHSVPDSKTMDSMAWIPCSNSLKQIWQRSRSSAIVRTIPSAKLPSSRTPQPSIKSSTSIIPA